jgi:hypothetical protein
MVSYQKTKGNQLLQRFREFGIRIIKPICIGVIVASGLILLYISLGFNYFESFLFASALENPDGFMFFSSPFQYLVTRIQDILDIVFFFGPVLTILAVEGIEILRLDNQDSRAKEIFTIFLAAIIALGLLFLTGAPKKGETARICMFILPFLLLPVVNLFDAKKPSRRDAAMLAVLVFIQTVFMQLMVNWVW